MEIDMKNQHGGSTFKFLAPVLAVSAVILVAYFYLNTVANKVVDEAVSIFQRVLEHEVKPEDIEVSGLLRNRVTIRNTQFQSIHGLIAVEETVITTSLYANPSLTFNNVSFTSDIELWKVDDVKLVNFDAGNIEKLLDHKWSMEGALAVKTFDRLTDYLQKASVEVIEINGVTFESLKDDTVGSFDRIAFTQIVNGNISRYAMTELSIGDESFYVDLGFLELNNIDLKVVIENWKKSLLESVTLNIYGPIESYMARDLEIFVIENNFRLTFEEIYYKHSTERDASLVDKLEVSFKGLKIPKSLTTAISPMLDGHLFDSTASGLIAVESNTEEKTTALNMNIDSEGDFLATFSVKLGNLVWRDYMTAINTERNDDVERYLSEVTLENASLNVKDQGSLLAVTKHLDLARSLDNAINSRVGTKF